MNIKEEINIFFIYDSKNLCKYNKETKDLMDFIKIDINKINRKGKYLQIKLVDENNKEGLLSLKNKNIVKFPVLFINNTPIKIYGCLDIQNYLINICKINNSNSHYTQNNTNILNNDIVHTYQMAQLGSKNKSGNLMNYNDEDEDNNELVHSKNNLSKATYETQRRMNMNNNQQSYNTETFSDNENMNTRSQNLNNRNRNVDMGNSNSNDINNLYTGNTSQPRIPFSGQNSYNGNLNSSNVSEIQNSMRHGRDERDIDLMVNFWENKEETKM